MHHDDRIFHIGYIEKPIFTDPGIFSILEVYWVYSLTHFSIAVIFKGDCSAVLLAISAMIVSRQINFIVLGI